MDGGVAAIVVALIGVAGTLIGTLFALKKDSYKLSKVELDTGEMKPEVKEINKYTEESDRLLTSNLEPTLNDIDHKLHATAGKVEYIARKIEFQDELKKSITFDLSPEHLSASINKLFEENAALNERCKSLYLENLSLTARI